MGKIPFLSEATVDMILRALGAGGYLPASADRDIIRNINPNLDEAHRDAFAVGFTYGAGGGGGSTDRLTGPEDCWVILDNNNTNPTTPYTNYFNIIKGQLGTPATDPKKMVFSIGSESGPDANHVHAAFGPRLDQVGVGDDMGSVITFGAGGNGATKWNYGSLTASKTLLVLAAHSSQSLGLEFIGGPSIANLATASITVGAIVGIIPTVRGGWYDLASTSRFIVGYPGVGLNEHSLAIERDIGGYEALRLRTVQTDAERQIYLMGSYSPVADTGCKWVQVVIGGQPGVVCQQPNNVVIGVKSDGSSVVDHKATLLVVSPDRGAVASCALQTWHRSIAVPDYTTLNNFHTSLNLAAASETIRVFSVTGLDGGGLKCVALATRGDRTTWAYGLRSPNPLVLGGLDVAENFSTEHPTNTYPPGTVMSSDSTGIAIPSDGYASVAVIGAVSTKPGMILGTNGELSSKEDPTKDLTVPIAMTGTTPVRVTDSHGEIHLNDLLVSDRGGTAAKAPRRPVPGTVIGKARAPWIGPGEGKIRMLIMLH